LAETEPVLVIQSQQRAGIAINMRFSIAIAFCVALSACSPRFSDRVEYRFDDVPYRHMRLTFCKDGHVSLDNNSAYRIGFSSYGKWYVTNGIMAIQIDHSNCIDSLKEIEYPQQGDTVDLVRLLKDPGYGTFPIIRTDTVQFSPDYKFAYLKGFRFEHNLRTTKLSRFVKTR
jgi:hypothetical protein